MTVFGLEFRVSWTTVSLAVVGGVLNSFFSAVFDQKQRTMENIAINFLIGATATFVAPVLGTGIKGVLSSISLMNKFALARLLVSGSPFIVEAVVSALSLMGGDYFTTGEIKSFWTYLFFSAAIMGLAKAAVYPIRYYSKNATKALELLEKHKQAVALGTRTGVMDGLAQLPKGLRNQVIKDWEIWAKYSSASWQFILDVIENVSQAIFPTPNEAEK